MLSNDQIILFSTFLAKVSIYREGMMKLFSVKQDIKKYTFHTLFLRKLLEDVFKPSNGLKRGMGCRIGCSQKSSKAGGKKTEKEGL